MDFKVSEELTSVQQLAQQILNDFTGVDQLKALDQQEERFDCKLWQALADAGLLGLDIEEAQGGTDLGFYALTALCEEVGRTRLNKESTRERYRVFLWGYSLIVPHSRFLSLRVATITLATFTATPSATDAGKFL